MVRDSVSTSAITCNGSDDAEVHIFASGGTLPYTFSIDDEVSYSNLGDFTGLIPGTYYLSIKDDNGCLLNSDTIDFDEPIALTVITETVTDITSCSYDATGQIDFAVTGGTGSIEYTLDSLVWTTTGHFEDLPSGNYYLTARDANLCSLVSTELIIDAPEPINAGISTSAYLNGLNKGSISISGASGGTGVLEYSIYGPTGSFSPETIYEGLDSGTYAVAIQDENNCLFEQDAVVAYVPTLDVTVTITLSDCNGDNQGSISLISSNGNPPLEYSINDSASWSDNGVFTELGPGLYYVFVRDGINRYFQDTIVISEPAALNVLGNVTSPGCSSFSNNGAINLSVTGGTNPYTYLWSNGEKTRDITNLIPGSYSINVSDSKNCESQKDFLVTPLITIIANAGPDTALCFGQPMILNGQGGPIMSWSPAEGLSNPNISNPVVSITEPAQYILTVTGFGDCFDIDTINLIVRPDAGLKAGNDTTVIKDAEVVLLASGGPFDSYSWEPAENLDTPDQPSATVHPPKTPFM